MFMLMVNRINQLQYHAPSESSNGKPVETYTLGQLQKHDFLTEEIYKNSFHLPSVPVYCQT